MRVGGRLKLRNRVSDEATLVLDHQEVKHCYGEHHLVALRQVTNEPAFPIELLCRLLDDLGEPNAEARIALTKVSTR
jgi:hypothetical protein